MAFVDDLDPLTPDGSDLVSQGDDRIRETKRALIERLLSVFADVNADPMVLIDVGTGTLTPSVGTKDLGATGTPYRDTWLSRTLTVTQGTITADTKAVSTTATWNNAAVTFTHWLASITDTASSAASKLIEFLVGGASRFALTKAGALSIAAGLTIAASGAAITGDSSVAGALTVTRSSTGPALTITNSSTGLGAIAISAGTRAFGIRNSTGTLDSRQWELRVEADGAGSFRSVSDAGTTVVSAISFAHATGNATMVGSLSGITQLNVDNLRLDGNTLSATTGAVNITPVAGSAIVLDGTISVDAGVVTGATSITSTAFVGDLTGAVTGTATNATNVNVVDSGADTTMWVLCSASQTGNTPARSDAGLTYNASTNALTTTTFIGALTGNVTGNVSGTAATVTGAAQTAITSLGNLTSLTVEAGATSPAVIITTTGGFPLRLRYDASNHATFTVTPTGSMSISLTGTSPVLELADVHVLAAMTLPGGLISYGANDSAGAGFRYVRVPNA